MYTYSPDEFFFFILFFPLSLLQVFNFSHIDLPKLATYGVDTRKWRIGYDLQRRIVASVFLGSNYSTLVDTYHCHLGNSSDTWKPSDLPRFSISPPCL